MITLNHILFDIKNIAYGGDVSDDANVNDRQIIYWINQARSALIHNKLQKKVKINDNHIQHLECVDLAQVDTVECCDQDGDCVILKSVKQIPITIAEGGNNAILSVDTIDHKHSFSETSYFRAKSNKHNKYTAHSKRWYLKNNYLYITNDLMIEQISISGIFEFPTEAANFKTCAGDPCFDNNSEYPVGADMAAVITDMVLKSKMGIIIKMPNDENNDASGSEKAPEQVQRRSNS